MTAHSFQLPANAENFAQLRAHTISFCNQTNVNSDVTCRLLVVLEELFINTVKHGYRGADGIIRIEIKQVPGYISIVYEDAAPPFDPLNAPSDAPEILVSKERVGGMGLPLIRKMTDLLAYERQEPWNRIDILLRNPE